MARTINTRKKRKFSEMEEYANDGAGWVAYIKNKCKDRDKHKLSKADKWKEHYRFHRRNYVQQIDDAATEFKVALQEQLARFVLVDLIKEFVVDDDTKQYLQQLDDSTKANSNNKNN